MSRNSVRILLAVATLLLTQVMAVGIARAGSPFSQVDLHADVTGGTVTATATVSSTSPIDVTSFGICVRDASGKNLDFPKQKTATITPTGTSITRTKSFGDGTYTFVPCLYHQGSWYEVGITKNFVVGGPTAPAPPSPSNASSSASTTSAAPPGATADNAIFLDDFSGPANSLPDPGKWSYQVGGTGWGNGELQYYTSADPDNVSMDGNGNLRITVRAEQYGGRSYTSARIRTLGKFDFLYGTVQARIKIPAGSGLWPAFWTQGSKNNAGITDDWPKMGEIDIMEAVNSDKGYGASLVGGPPRWSRYKWSAAPRRDNEFHIYSATWSPGKVSFFVDGAPVNTVTKDQIPPGASWPFDTARQYLLLNVAMGGSYPGPPDGSAVLPATMLVDYVKVTP